MRSSLLFLVLIFLPILSFAQWYYQNPKPVGSPLNCVKFIDENVAWAIGHGGVIVKTKDGGENWQQLPNLQAGGLIDLFIQDSLTAWAVGLSLRGAAIIKTTDGWKSRKLITFPIQRQLYSVFFINEHTGWVCGDSGIILKTINGGDSWNFMPSGSQALLHSIAFFNEQTGIAVGDSGEILRSIDAGASWTCIKKSQNSKLSGISIVGAASAWVSDYYGNLLYSMNRGETWSDVSTVLSGFMDVFFTDSLCGWASLTNGYYILRTTDGGTTWTSNSTGTNHSFNSLCFANTMKGCAVGYGGNVITTDDGGVTWKSQTTGPQNQLLGVSAYDDKFCWVVGDQGLILNTQDGGENWNIQNSGVEFSLWDIRFTTPLKGWAVGDLSSVLFTNDGGTTWQKEQNSQIYGQLKKVFFVDENHGWICGRNNTMYRTTNGGNNWQSLYVLSDCDLNDEFFLDSLNGWIVGRILLDSVVIMSTNNGGISWTRQSNGLVNNLPLNAIQFINKDTGFVAGNAGNFYRTFDGGSHWEFMVRAGSVYPINGLHFRNSKEGWLFGHEGIYYTSNGGESFILQWPLYVNTGSFADQNNGWAVGQYGTILHTANGGFPLGIEKPPSFLNVSGIMATAYPNPVSLKSAITVEYLLPNQGNTSVSLLDIRGNAFIVQNLEFQNKGEHQFVIPVQSLSPGLYFIQIRNSNQVINKKIVVIN